MPPSGTVYVLSLGLTSTRPSENERWYTLSIFAYAPCGAPRSSLSRDRAAVASPCCSVNVKYALPSLARRNEATANLYQALFCVGRPIVQTFVTAKKEPPWAPASAIASTFSFHSASLG